MKSLNVQIIPHPQATIVALQGSADIAGTSDLDRALTVLSAQHPTQLVFDLSELKFISSLGMGLLIRFAHGMQSRGCSMRLAAAQPMVSEALRRMRMEAILPMFAGVEEAMPAPTAT